MAATLRLTAAAVLACASTAAAAPPAKHVVFILADDLGWNDVSAHGSPQIPTPNIDAIFSSGMRLNELRASPVCSPTRSSILSGRHVSHTGVFMPFSEGSNLVLNTSFALMPSYFSNVDANIKSHLVGKFHLGLQDNSTLPTSRGFHSHRGYWMGAETYFTHDAGYQNSNGGAYDFHDSSSSSLGPSAPDLTANNSWSTELIAQRAVELIRNASLTGERLFLYTAFQNVHWPLQAPQSYMDSCSGRTGGNTVRQAICAMAMFLDDAVGNVTAALKETGLWDDTLLVFQSDNGGPTNMNEGTFSDNFPLRGGKNTLWEGGTRVAGAISGGALPAAAIASSGGVYGGFVHVTDWLPTFIHAFSGSANWTSFIPAGQPPFKYGDGLDLWPALAAGDPTVSPRSWVLLETHPPSAPAGKRVHGDGLIVGDWKLLRIDTEVLPQEENGWWPPPGQDPASTPYTVRCTADGSTPRSGAAPNKQQCVTGWCLFNITADPCEYDDVSSSHPDVVSSLRAALANFSATAVPPVAPAGCSPLRVPLPNGALAWEPCSNE